ncbi:hypothetical protein A1A1_16755 [Planococcus antarcticus DSM 14505]|uniref:Uncharacterized protein n=1 Tax=Planococcus antarcticus DSM 14505 TaxID=1185653 RepID=A0AA87IKY0_9BACL|nr:hypothetical protein [Planococcus antarcticus]EIM05333.1 hypothetical protein A1A1_16755 [Planococcus antarcticus DSM 14505]
MATIFLFPVKEQQQPTTICTGCSKSIRGDYWEVGVPKEQGKEYLALCNSCNDELMKHGVVL